MRIKPEWSYRTLILKNADGGLAFIADTWPERLTTCQRDRIEVNE